jgi:hypothetical protein
MNTRCHSIPTRWRQYPEDTSDTSSDIWLIRNKRSEISAASRTDRTQRNLITGRTEIDKRYLNPEDEEESTPNLKLHLMTMMKKTFQETLPSII